MVVLSVMVVMVLAIVVSVSGCADVNLGVDYDSEVVSDVFQKMEDIDLSQYDSHGEWSCGRIWVTKTEGNWDAAPTECFAYLDLDGNVIYGWEPVGSVWGGRLGAYIDAKEPQNFVDGRAMIVDRGFGDGSTQKVTIIDLDGNVLYSPCSIYVEYYEKRNFERDYYITNFDKDGYAFFVGKVWWDGNTEGEFGVYWLDDRGVHKVNTYLPTSNEVIHSIERIDNSFFVSYGAYSILFDSHGDVIIDFKESADICPYRIELLNEELIRAYFEGKDNRKYVCILNCIGEFWETPVLLTEYGVMPPIFREFTAEDYEKSMNSGMMISDEMVGTWKVVTGADKHQIIISDSGKLTCIDGEDRFDTNYVLLSPTEIVVADMKADVAYTFSLRNGKLIRYSETGFPDDYTYVK